MKKALLIPVLIFLLFVGLYFFRTNKNSLTTQTIPTPTLAVREELTKDQIIRALSQKNNWDQSKVELNSMTVEGEFAKGGVKFKDGMGEGLWFAARVNGAWKIVYDGNGIIPCDSIATYQNFPKDMIPSCYDKQTEKLLTR